MNKNVYAIMSECIVFLLDSPSSIILCIVNNFHFLLVKTISLVGCPCNVQKKKYWRNKRLDFSIGTPQKY